MGTGTSKSKNGGSNISSVADPSKASSNNVELPRTVSELPSSSIRWFWRGKVGENWNPLSGVDSANVERVYAQQNSTCPVAHLQATAIRDFLYDVEAAEGKLNLRPIFWDGDKLELLRGTWFFKEHSHLSPFGDEEHEMVQALETEYLTKFRNQAVQTPAKYNSDAKPVFELMNSSERAKPNTGVRIQAFSPSDVFAFTFGKRSIWKRWTNGKQQPIRLIRGYDEPAVADDGARPSHVIFVSHGAGQVYNGPTIISDTDRLRTTAKELWEHHFTDRRYRITFIPIQWRTGLQFDNALLARLSPNGVNFIRQFANQVIMDTVLFALSNVRDHLITVLNEAYGKYLLRDPAFADRGGRVSVIAHSMGGVAAADVIGKCISIAATDHVSQELNFTIRHTFVIGSPVGAYLQARHGQRYDGWKTLLGQTILNNVYYADDPFAYRLEPLVSDSSGNMPAVKIHAHYKGNNTKYKRKVDAVSKSDAKAAAPDAPVTHESSIRDPTTENHPPYRLDFKLKSSRYAKLVASLMSHFDYWNSRDLVMYVLQTLDENME